MTGEHTHKPDLVTERTLAALGVLLEIHLEASAAGLSASTYQGLREQIMQVRSTEEDLRATCKVLRRVNREMEAAISEALALEDDCPAIGEILGKWRRTP